MLPLRYSGRWQLAGIFLLATVLVAALMPAIWWWSDKEPAVPWFEHVDKLLHVLTFVVLSVWYSGLYQKDAYWKLALGLFAFGLLIEACQGMVSYRTADWIDVAADVVGIGIGLGIGIVGIGGWCLRVEERLARS